MGNLYVINKRNVRYLHTSPMKAEAESKAHVEAAAEADAEAETEAHVEAAAEAEVDAEV